MIKAVWIAALLVCASGTWAQVYSWQDEQGRTHYSDQPLHSKAREQALDIARMPEMRVLDKVIAPEFDDTYVPPFVGDVAYGLNEIDRLAYFYFGGDCVSPTRLDYSALVTRYHQAMPPVDDLRRVLASVMQRSFSRGVKVLSQQNATFMADKSTPFLQAEIVDMRINACAPVLPKNIPSDTLSAFSLSMFKRSHVWLKVNWSLISRETTEVLTSVVTEGAAESLETRRSGIPDIITYAFRDAATGVLNQQAVVELLQRSIGKEPPVAVMPKASTPVSMPEGYGGLMVNANLAKVLTSLTHVRFRLAEYHSQHNEWPVSLDEIDHHEQSLAATGVISSLELRYAGVLHVNLNNSVFPGNHILQMLPTWDAGSWQIFWECRTTVKSTLSACEQH